MINNIITYFWLFLTSPKSFTIKLISDTNNTDLYLFFSILIAAIFFLFSNGLYLYFGFRPKQKSLAKYIRYILQSLLGFSFWLIGFPFYPVALLKGSSLTISNVISFMVITPIICLVWFLSSIILGFLIINRILLILNPLFPDSILKAEYDVKQSLSFSGYLGTTCNFVIFAVITIFSCYIFLNFLRVLGFFYDFSWWILLLLTMVYSISLGLIRFILFFLKERS